ncbi:hypothetical protein [Haloechinothrix salitolerans]|uniref:LPXTG-motif cell wall anchor domain-containing protein n=1 Tax=Haloechinothrix salitolerans TaxID=926830 RepID=A0ABW2BVD1_9PSEU
MAFEKNRVRAAVLALPLAVGLSLGAATAAQATEDAKEDPRATSYTGQENAKTCKDIGVSGELIAYLDEDDGEYTERITYERGQLEDNRYLDILSVDPEVDVTGIVVKGADGYNVYIPGEEGDGGVALNENPPWKDLRSPLKKGKVPQISHWYICGVDNTPPSESSSPAPSSEPSSPAPSSEPSSPAPSSSEPTPSGTTPPGTTTDTTSTTAETSPASTTSTTDAPVVDNVSDSDDLAVTGFGSSWLIWAGVLFVVAGVGTIAGLRVLRKQ